MNAIKQKIVWGEGGGFYIFLRALGSSSNKKSFDGMEHNGKGGFHEKCGIPEM